ncbi:MAG: putative sporulation protein YtxC [Bacteroidota bacterium]
MSGITISTLNLDPEVRGNLLKEINFLKREGIKVEYNEKAYGKYLFLECAVSETDEMVGASHEKIFRYYLASIITDLLMNEIAKEMMGRIVRTKYQYLSKEELKSIVQNAYIYLSNLNEEGDISKTLFRHNQILTEVNQFMETNSRFYLEGFLRFRLKDYFKELEISIEKAVENFLIEQEYNEFLRLLRYFVEIQEPRIDEVHLLVKDKKSFCLLDEDQQPINQDQLQGALTELNQEVEYEDLLLSTLITMSPRNIVLHVVNKTEIVETILSVFRERVNICQGCDLCQRSKPQLTETQLWQNDFS